MFDASSLIYLGNDNTVRTCVAGELYMFISQKKKVQEYTPFFATSQNNTKLKCNDTNVSTTVLLKNKYSEKGKWMKCYCFIKANFFYVYKFRTDYKPYVIFLLENSKIEIVNYYIELKNQAIDQINDFHPKSDDNILKIKPTSCVNDNTYTFYFQNGDILKKWLKHINNSNVASLNNNLNMIKEEYETIKNDIDNLKKLNDIELKNKDIEISSLNERINFLKADIENIRTKNKRLQIAADVNIKSADEFLQQKITEMEYMHNELTLKIKENEELKDNIGNLRSESEENIKIIERLKVECILLENELKRFFAVYEEARGDPEKITLINMNTNKRYQDIVLDNKNLKAVITKMNERFYDLEDRYKEKIKTIKEVMEIGDIFDYLHKLIILCQTKIKYYEEGYKYTEEKEKNILNTLENMIKETKLSETNARVCYITHRSKILDERLEFYLNNKTPTDYFYFACTTLRRLGWIFGEIEVLQPIKINENDNNNNFNNTYPLYTYVDNMEVIPLREQIYFNEAIEGRNNYKIVNNVDIYTMPIKMCPYEEKVLTDNKYNYIKIKLIDLKNDFNILKNKNKPKDMSIISDLQWAQIKKDAYERLEKNIIILQNKNL
ncbi:conserved protein, unknown function [Hepatocystis sp. ex Piliocolobus tephrosceles]|nr:conserved protein, unknown function [Hepatocystis sp. ex Piliocolobus tephrosceles]